jgi:hypothetical protein
MTRKSEVMMDLIRRRKFNPLDGVEEFVRSLWRHCPLAICSGRAAGGDRGDARRAGAARLLSRNRVGGGRRRSASRTPRGYVLTMKMVGEKICEANLETGGLPDRRGRAERHPRSEAGGLSDAGRDDELPAGEAGGGGLRCHVASAGGVRKRVPELKAVLQ